MSLTNRKPAPDPSASYEPIQSYSGPGGTFATDRRLNGDHPEVRERPHLWMLSDQDDDEKGQIRSEAIFGAAIRSHPPQKPLPVAQRPSGRFRAIGSWSLPDPDLRHRARISAGDIVHADDEVFKRYPHLFTRHIEER